MKLYLINESYAKHYVVADSEDSAINVFLELQGYHNLDEFMQDDNNFGITQVPDTFPVRIYSEEDFVEKELPANEWTEELGEGYVGSTEY